MASNKRRIYWINPKSQTKYLTQIILLELAVAVVCVVMTAFITLFMMQMNSSGSVVSPGEYWFRIYAYMVGMCVLFGGILIFLGIRISHKIFGPIYRFEQVFKQGIEERRIPDKFGLRDKDEFHDLSILINQYFDIMRENEEQQQAVSHTEKEQPVAVASVASE